MSSLLFLLLLLLLLMLMMPVVEKPYAITATLNRAIACRATRSTSINHGIGKLCPSRRRRRRMFLRIWKGIWPRGRGNKTMSCRTGKIALAIITRRHLLATLSR